MTCGLFRLKKPISGSANRMEQMPNSSPRAVVIQRAAAANEALSSVLPAPRECPVLTCPPIFGRVASPLESHMYMPAAPTEATALLPSLPIQSMSVRL